MNPDIYHRLVKDFAASRPPPVADLATEDTLIPGVIGGREVDVDASPQSSRGKGEGAIREHKEPEVG